MSKRIITISREFGSGGRTIGKMVAEKLGIAFYDKELIEKIAEETGFSQKFIEEAVKSRFRSVSLQKWMKSGQVHGDSLLTVSCRSVLTVIRSP